MFRYFYWIIYRGIYIVIIWKMAEIILKSLTTQKKGERFGNLYKGNYLVGKFKGQIRIMNNGEIEITISNMKLGKELQELLKKYQ